MAKHVHRYLSSKTTRNHLYCIACKWSYQFHPPHVIIEASYWGSITCLIFLQHIRLPSISSSPHCHWYLTMPQCYHLQRLEPSPCNAPWFWPPTVLWFKPEGGNWLKGWFDLILHRAGIDATSFLCPKSVYIHCTCLKLAELLNKWHAPKDFFVLCTRLPQKLRAITLGEPQSIQTHVQLHGIEKNPNRSQVVGSLKICDQLVKNGP